jgi:RNA polymerase sigma-70 factor (ECF subfamily)
VNSAFGLVPSTNKPPNPAPGTTPPDRSRQPKTHLVQIVGFSCPIVSSLMSRRNKSPAQETIFRLACRRPETLADYQFAQRSRQAANWELVMQNVIALNAAARQGIIAAQATSDEMLLESISDGDRTAMHILYSRHNVRVYRFILRMVRDTTMAEDLVSQAFLDVWRTARQFEGRSQVSTWLLSIARFKALTALRQRRHEDIDQEDMLEIADEADTPEASLDRSNTSAILRACVAKLSPAHREIINLVYYHEKSVEEAGAIIGIPQSTVKTRMFYARKQLADLLRGAGIDSLAA